MIAVAAPASAATGSYGFTTWNQPLNYNYGVLDSGANLTPPAGIPSTATVTSLSGTVFFANLPCPGACPPQATATGFACYDANNTKCIQLGTNSASFPAWISWSGITTGGATLNASTTVFHFVFVINNNNGTHNAIIPPVYLGPSRNLTVNYSY